MISMPLFRHNMKVCALPCIIIFLVLAMYTSVIIYMYDPKFADMLNDYQQAMPEIMSAVGMSGIASSLIEWMQIYLYGFIMLLFPLIFIIIAVNKLVMTYIDKGSVAGLLATPNSRGKIIVTQLLSVYLWIVILMVLILATGLVCSKAIFPGELEIKRYLCLNLGTLTLWIAVAGIAFFAACVCSEAKYYYLFGAGIPILFFLFQMMGNMGDKLKFFRYMTIYTLLPAEEIVAGNQGAVVPCLILLGISIGLWVAGCVVFTRKDLAV